MIGFLFCKVRQLICGTAHPLNSRDGFSESYRENPPAGPINLEEKLGRQKAGGPFEWPNIVALNQCIARHLVKNAKKVLELGGGTGRFAWELGEDAAISITCSEFDRKALDWAIENRNRPNITYTSEAISPSENDYDLVVAIEVIEHIEDFVCFFRLCASLGPRIVLTTPNKSREPRFNTAGPPEYYQHVREWNAGEFYWVAKCFFHEVNLYAMPDQYDPASLVPVTVMTTLTPLIAECSRPRHADWHTNRQSPAQHSVD